MAPNKPTLLRPLAWEEMHPEQREYYGSPRPQASDGPETIHKYNSLDFFDEQIDSYHREKRQ